MRAVLVAAIAATFALALSTAARAATITVSTLSDPTGPSGTCSLRDAITAANTKAATNGCAAGTGNDTIDFSVTGTITLGSTLPQITDSKLTIKGPASPGITISGGGNVEVMVVASGARLNLNKLTIAHGNAAGVLDGGAIFNVGTVTVTNSTFSGNRACAGSTGCTFAGDRGGAIFTETTLTVTNSTFSGNQAYFGGGAIAYCTPPLSGTLTVTNSTFSGNSTSFDGTGGAICNGRFPRPPAINTIITNSTFSGNTDGSFGGGGIWNDGGASVAITNSTFSANSSGGEGGGINNSGVAIIKSTILASSSIGNCAGAITDAGYNISDALQNGSPAINAIPLVDCTDQSSPPKRITKDQRGFPRPDAAESACDIGAYESSF